MVFTTLLFGEGLSSADRARATRLCSALLVTSIEQSALVGETGWDLIERVNISGEYEETARRDLQAYKSRSDKVTELLGKQALEERLNWRREYIQAIEGGLLQRELFVADVPD